MFLSLDIVGSTEFKQSARGSEYTGGADSWVAPFLSFYRVSVEHMAAEWNRVTAEVKSLEGTEGNPRFDFGEAPAFWKGAGDEVLFSKIVKSPFDAMTSIYALLEVMKEHRRQFGSKPQTKRLNVKGAAWLAGFPINNAEIRLAAQHPVETADYLDDPIAENYRLLELHGSGGHSSDVYLADYIGPSIDLGFRIREHATPRKLVVSADLAWLLCFAHRENTIGELPQSRYLRMPHIGYEGRYGLKGILSGEPYPLIWVESDIGNAIDKAEDLLLGRKHPDGHGSDAAEERPLWDFCEAFLNSQGPLRMRPYIPGYPNTNVGIISPEHQKRLKDIETLVNGPGEQLESLDRTDSAGAGIPKEAKDFAKQAKNLAYLVVNDIEASNSKEQTIKTVDRPRSRRKGS